MKGKGLGYFYLINTVILFSTYEVVSKTLVGKVDPFQINFIRFLIGGLILLAFLFVKRDMEISRRDVAWVSVIGIINVVLSMNLLQLSLYVNNSKASMIAVIFSSNPIFVSIFSAVIEKEKISFFRLVGLLTGLAGIFIVFSDKLGLDSMDYRSPLLALGSAVLYGLYTVLGRRVSIRIGSLKMNSYSFIVGSLVLLPFLLFMGRPVIAFDPAGILQVIYLSVMVTGVAYLTYFMGLSVVGATSGSLVFFLKPVLASVTAIAFLREELTLNLLLGTAFIIMGILVVINSHKIQNYFRK